MNEQQHSLDTYFINDFSCGQESEYGSSKCQRRDDDEYIVWNKQILFNVYECQGRCGVGRQIETADIH